MKEADESMNQAQEGLIRKGLLKLENDEISIDAVLEDSKEIIKKFLIVKESKIDDVFENIAFIALVLLNKFVDLSEDELIYLISMALAKTKNWKDALRKMS